MIANKRLKTNSSGLSTGAVNALINVALTDTKDITCNTLTITNAVVKTYTSLQYGTNNTTNTIANRSTGYTTAPINGDYSFSLGMYNAGTTTPVASMSASGTVTVTSSGYTFLTVSFQGSGVASVGLSGDSMAFSYVTQGALSPIPVGNQIYCVLTLLNSVTVSGGLTASSLNVTSASGNNYIKVNDNSDAITLSTTQGALLQGNVNVTGTLKSGNLFTAQNGVTVSAGNISTSNGTISSSGAMTAGGLLTANGGLTIGGANNITLGSGATAPGTGQLGAIIPSAGPATLSTVLAIAANTWTNVLSITLTPGVWIASGVVNFISASTSYTVCLSTNSAPVVTDNRFQLVHASAFGSGTIMPVTRLFRVTANTTVYLAAYTSTTGNIDTTPTSLSAIRIA